MCIFDRFLHKFYPSYWNRPMNGPGFWLIGISHICIGYSCVFSWAFVAGRVKFQKAPNIRSLLYIFYDGKGCHVWIFLSLFFGGEETRIRNIGRQWKDLPELVAVMGFRQIYYILALPVAGKGTFAVSNLNEDPWFSGTMQISF